MVTARQADPNANTAALELAIDRQVYALYHPTPEDIETVEELGK